MFEVCACGRTKGLSDRPLETFGHIVKIPKIPK